MHPLLILVVTALVVIPFWMILPRAGVAPAWALAAIIPLGAVVLLWVLALKSWPGDTADGGA
ncbi:MAG TPA: hypothetical protein VLA52_17710 [Thermohalobaculum sp.]|nr:hypothetical protein [Thermohalobaculum sp.]